MNDTGPARISAPWPSLAVILLVLSLAYFFECSETYMKHRLVGRWTTDVSPRLVLMINDDGTYQYGPLDPRHGDPVRGTWTVEHRELVLVAGTQIERAPVTVHEARSCAKSGLTFGDKTFLPSD